MHPSRYRRRTADRDSAGFAGQAGGRHSVARRAGTCSRSDVVNALAGTDAIAIVGLGRERVRPDSRDARRALMPPAVSAQNAPIRSARACCRPERVRDLLIEAVFAHGDGLQELSRFPMITNCLGRGQLVLRHRQLPFQPRDLSLLRTGTPDRLAGTYQPDPRGRWSRQSGAPVGHRGPPPPQGRRHIPGPDPTTTSIVEWIVHRARPLDLQVHPVLVIRVTGLTATVSSKSDRCWSGG